MSDPLLPISPVPATLEHLFQGSPITEYGLDEETLSLGRAIIAEILERGNDLSLATPLGSGARSSSWRYEFNGKPYILRITSLEYGGNNDSLLTEINAYGALNDTPNPYIAKLLYALSSKSRRHPFKGTLFVFPYMAGHTLDAVIKHSHSMSFHQAKEYLIYFLNACDYMNEKGIVHRDIKPENIFIPDHEDPYLFDFDVACETKNGTCRSNIFQGTRAYAIPKAKSRLPQNIAGFEEGTPYTYSVWSDKFAVIKIITKDILPLIKSHTSRDDLLDMAIDVLKGVFAKNNEINRPTPAERTASAQLLEEIITHKTHLSVSKSANHTSSHRSFGRNLLNSFQISHTGPNSRNAGGTRKSGSNRRKASGTRKSGSKKSHSTAE